MWQSLAAATTESQGPESSCGLAAATVGDRPTWGSGDCLDTYILPLDVGSVPSPDTMYDRTFAPP